MNSAASLRASADMADAMGKHGRARFYREMADNALAMGEIGNALYSHWASDIAERTALDFGLHAINQSKGRECSLKSGSRADQ